MLQHGRIVKSTSGLPAWYKATFSSKKQTSPSLGTDECRLSGTLNRFYAIELPILITESISHKGHDVHKDQDL
jgi:hypothetical protein